MGDETTAKFPIGGAILLALIVAFYLIGSNSWADGEESHERDDQPGFTESRAWDYCSEAVEAEARNPETVDFVLTSVKTVRDGEGFDIAGSFTAQNDLGAVLSYVFSCDVSETGADVQITRP